MTIMFRGNCFPEKTQVEAISHPNFSKFKNYWVKRECYLHFLFEKEELPELTPDDLILIPEEFNPSEKHLNYYRKKFNMLLKRKRNSMLEERKFNQDISRDKNKWRIKFSNLWEHEFNILADPTNLYQVFDEKNLKFKKINNELNDFQKISIQLINSTFLLHSCPSDRNKDKTLTREDLKIMDRGCKRVLVKRLIK